MRVNRPKAVIFDLDDTIIYYEIGWDASSGERGWKALLFPDAAETLNGLRDMGVRLALVTNGPSEIQRGKIDGFGLESFFDVILIEGEFGVGKPDRRVYEHVLGELDVKPEETWMIGDNLEWEVAGPQRAGIAGIWYDPEEEGLPEGGDFDPDMVVNSLSELLACIKGFDSPD